MNRILLAAVMLVTLAQPAASQPVAPDAYLIVPGESVGSVKLGMNITEVTSVLGTPKSTQGRPDGSVIYRWYEFKGEGGIGLRATRTGEVYRIWVANNTRYATKEGIRVGSSEAEIRVALGEPTKAEEDHDSKDMELSYDNLGVAFTINLDPKYTYYKHVYWVEISAPKNK